MSSLADIKGKKMRTYNAQTARLATLMGTVPTTVQATEIPQAFSAGIIDTMFTAGQTGVTMRAWEYTRFFYDTRAWVPKNVVLVNEGAFRKLPADVQKAVLDAAQVAEARGWKMSEEQNDRGAEDARQERPQGRADDAPVHGRAEEDRPHHAGGLARQGEGRGAEGDRRVPQARAAVGRL